MQRHTPGMLTGLISWSARGGRRIPTRLMERAATLADRAIALDPYDSRALTIVGHITAFLHHRLHEALMLHERALSLNPNLAMAWAFSGLTHGYLGNLDEAERRFTRYKRLSPLDPHAFLFDNGIAFTHLLKRDYEVSSRCWTRSQSDEPILLERSQAVSFRAWPFGSQAGSSRRASAAFVHRAKILGQAFP